MGDITLLSSAMPNLLPMENRSAGLHVSEIIHYLCYKLGIFKEREPSADGAEADPNMAWMQLGCALEHAIAQRYELHEPGRYSCVGELEQDNIYLTPDLYDHVDNAVVEIKLAWMSSDQDVDGDRFWRYWVQVKAYCYVLETLIGRLHVAHVMGNYRDKREPRYNVWEQRFTREELVSNWQMLVTTAQTDQFHSWLRDHDTLDRKIARAKFVANQKRKSAARAKAAGAIYLRRP